MQDLEQLWAQQALESEPVVRDLERVGYSETDWENATDPTGQVVDVLLEHLRRPHPEHVLAWIASILGQTRTEQVWGALASALAAASPDQALLREGLAASLSQIARPQHLPLVLAYLSDSSLGADRVFFLRTLTSLRVPNRWELIEAGLSDPDLSVEAAHMLHQRELREARRVRQT